MSGIGRLPGGGVGGTGGVGSTGATGGPPTLTRSQAKAELMATLPGSGSKPQLSRTTSGLPQTFGPSLANAAARLAGTTE